MSTNGALPAPGPARVPAGLDRALAGPARRVLPVLGAALAVGGEVVAVLAAVGASARWNEVAVAGQVVGYAAVGVLVLWHLPGHPVGRIAVGIAAAQGVGQALVATSYAALADHPGDQGAALASVVGSTLRGLPWLVAVTVLPLVFPDGQRLRTRLSRGALALAVVVTTLFTAVSLFSPTLTDTRVQQLSNPIGLHGPAGRVMDPLAALVALVGVVSIGLAVAVLVQRFRRTGALGRQQTLVFALSFVAPVVCFPWSLSDAAGPWLFGLSGIPVPVAIGVAVLQRRIFDLPLAVNRSLTYGTLWLAIAALYALVVGGVGAMVQQQGADWLPWVAAGVVAVSFAPMREALQRSANRITYGQWAQPAEVLAGTERRLQDLGDVPALLGSLAEELCTGLGLGYVEIADTHGGVLARAGSRDGELDELPLTVYGTGVGTLRFTRRSLRESDRELLTGLARRLGEVVHADGLLASVRAAQERLVVAREEERRRLRRDLHDGLGPALAGLALQVDTLRNTLPGGPDPGADEGLARLREGIGGTVADVRRIVEGLRPRSLDDLGLAESVRQLASGVALSVTVEVGDLPQLPAAVEVAAYRIVQEALANAARHSGASVARVRLAWPGDGDRLAVEIDDDGTGLVVPRVGGVGLDSMRERAEEIGGSFEVGPGDPVGTTVRVLLPARRP